MIQEMLVDIIYDFYHFKVLILNHFNLEYFYLAEKVIICDDTLFGISKIIGMGTMGYFKWCGHICIRHGGSQLSVLWFEKNMQNLPIQVYDPPNNMSYNYTYTLSYLCLDDVYVDTIPNFFLQILGVNTHVQ